MQTQRIPLADTRLHPEARRRDKATVEVLAGSMNRLGLLNPITVMPAVYTARGRADNPGFLVLAGGHRFEAARMLGWEEIDAFVLDCAGNDYKRQRMVEITENLHRAELTALERSKLVAEWAELTGEKVSQVETVSGGRGHEGGTRKAARQLGLDKEDVRRSRKVAALSPEAQAAAVEEGLDDNRTATAPNSPPWSVPSWWRSGRN